jgi:hypothetical protein
VEHLFVDGEDLRMHLVQAGQGKPIVMLRMTCRRSRRRSCRTRIRRVEKVVAYPPLPELSTEQRREFHEALLEARFFEDLPGQWPAAILKAEQDRPKLRVVSGD